MLADLRALPIVRGAVLVKSMAEIYGKRIIVMGGGAQVGQVAMGAIVEADRHNIRGEHISVDTIPLVASKLSPMPCAPCAGCPRVCARISWFPDGRGDRNSGSRGARRRPSGDQPEYGGSVPDAADLVVTDPLQAGVMAVMAVANTAKFTIERLKRRVF